MDTVCWFLLCLLSFLTEGFPALADGKTNYFYTCVNSQDCFSLMLKMSCIHSSSARDQRGSKLSRDLPAALTSPIPVYFGLQGPDCPFRLLTWETANSQYVSPCRPTDRCLQAIIWSSPMANLVYWPSLRNHCCSFCLSVCPSLFPSCSRWSVNQVGPC